MLYLGWYDDNPKKPLQDKIHEAVEAYEDRFGTRPNVVLVNEKESDVIPVEGVQVESKPFIRRNYFWVGWHEPTPA